jgi:hypothetical protein
MKLEHQFTIAFLERRTMLISNEYVCHRRKMDVLVDVADRISRTLA